jgi:hypothetical protein
MPQERLNCSDVGTPLEQMGGKTVSKSVCTGPLVYSGLAYSFGNGFVYGAGVQMMPAGFAGPKIIRKLL